MYMQNRNRLTDIENKLVITKVAMEGGGTNEEVVSDIYRLLCIKQISNKDLLYSTGKAIQYRATMYMGEESEKEWIYV